MRADNSHHLARAAAARHDLAVARVHDVLRELDGSGQAVTVSGVARAAVVSRSWLYSQPELREAITRLRTKADGMHRSALPATQRATSASLQRRLDSTRDEIEHLRAENAALRQRVARSLGEARANR